jgi:hypothetical protein
MKFLIFVCALCVFAHAEVVSDGFLNRVDVDYRQLQASADCTDAL